MTNDIYIYILKSVDLTRVFPIVYILEIYDASTALHLNISYEVAGACRVNVTPDSYSSNVP